MKIAALILNIIFSLLFFCCPASSKEIKNEIILTPSQDIKQGETVFIEIKTDSGLKDPYFIFNNEKIKLYKKSKHLYSGYLGINALLSPNKYPITVYSKDKIINQTLITIISANFPIDNIIISGEKSKLTIDQEEQNKIFSCLKSSSKKAGWKNLPLNTPTDGYITSLFGGIRYKNGQPTGNYHKGVDIGADEGQNVFSVANGKVILAEKFVYFGNTVIIDHGQGLSSVYMHLSEIYVKKNEKVKQGQIIAKVGSTGYATGPHLHFSIYINGTPVNPLGLWLEALPLYIN